MATFTIKSRNHGNVTFYCWSSDREQYVKVAFDDHADTTSRQICNGGGFWGNTITAKPETLEKTARSWWRRYLRNERTN